MAVNLKHIDAGAIGALQSFDQDEIRIGRHKDNDVIFDEQKFAVVSRRHAEIYRDGQYFFIKDLQSRNGTLVNSRQISAPTRLNDGDIVQFSPGGPKVVFSVSAASHEISKAPVIAQPPAGDRAAAYARDCATQAAGNDFRALSQANPWEAVALCARQSGAITADQYESLRQVSATNFSAFVRMIDPIVGDAESLRGLAQGALLGFIEIKNNIPTLIHAMIATGQGFAAGNKNATIGIGNPSGWEVLDLAGDLNWITGSNCFNAVPAGKPGRRTIQIRSRAL